MRQFAPLILLVAAVLGTFFYTKPLYADIQQQSSDKTQYEAAIQQAQALQSKINDLNNIKNSFSSTDLDRLNKMIPQNIDSVRLIIELNEIAKKYDPNGISAISIDADTDPNSSSNDSSGDTSSSTGAEGANQYQIGFSVSTSYSQFLDFLQDIESNLRLEDVVGLSFSPTDTGSNYTFNVLVRTYWLK